VRGKNSHAWPEVWFGEELGWVPFEPTPGRGAPGAESYTGLLPTQDTTPADPNAGATDDAPAAPATTVPTSVTFADPDAQTTIPSGVRDSAGGNSGTPIDTSKGLPLWPFVMIALIALIAAAPALVRRGRRRLLRHASADQRVGHAWARATNALRLAGVAGRPSMTTREWATATAAVLPVAARPMWSLSGIVDAITFGTPGMVDLDAVSPYGGSVARDCAAWSRQVEEIVSETLTPRERFVRYVTDWG
jgi:hypothetical protein